MNTQNKKVFLTGATGFVGAYLVRALLSEGYEIRAMKRKGSPLLLLGEDAKEVEWVEGDLLDLPFLEEVMQGVEQVYHAAAMVSFDPKDVRKMMEVNVRGTENLVNTALVAGVDKFLQISSIAALGRKKNEKRIDEKAQWENNSINSNYAISKFKAECEVWRGVQEGLNAVIVNPSVILGAGYWHSGTGKMFVQANKGLRFYPQGVTGFVDVRDVAWASVKLMQSEISAERFILNAENYSYLQLFSEMAEALGKKAPKWKMPHWGVELMWRAELLRSKALGVKPLITKELARNLESHYEYSAKKIEKAIDYKFIPLSQTIKETAVVLKESMNKNQAFGKLKM
jgi:dihydroflavonol-4-reductase